MKKGNDLRMELYRVSGDVAALVKVDYLDKDAEEHTGLMILDTGSDRNILSKTMIGRIAQYSINDGDSMEILTLTGEKVSFDVVPFSFAMGGVQFHENFCINDSNHLPHINGEFPIIGILGNIFLQRYNLSIDYSDFTLKTSHVNPDNLAISDCDFFFPMDIGLRYYGVPALCMVQGEMEIVAMVDTGATLNMISAPCLSNNGFCCEYLESTDLIKGLSGSVETKEAVLSYELVTLNVDDEGLIQHKDIFKVCPDYLINPQGKCNEKGEALEPVEALIGCPFMAKEGWTLDFGVNIIYKRKPDYEA